MDQHEPGNDLHIPVDTPPRLNVHKTFCEVYDVLLTGFVGSVKVVCPLGSRNISKLMVKMYKMVKMYFFVSNYTHTKSVNKKTYTHKT